MIEDYLQEKEHQKKLQELRAWQQFYLDNNNEWKAGLVEREIEKL